MITKSKFKKESQKLKQKFEEDEDFREKVNERQKKYQTYLHESFYYNLREVNEELLVGYNRGQQPIYFYFGLLQDSSKENIHKTVLYFIRFFNRIPKEDYIFVFFNTKAPDSAYSTFRQVFLQLTYDHFLNLNQFIVVRPTRYQRAQNLLYSFNVFTSYLNAVTTYFHSGSELCEHLKINPVDFIDLAPREVSMFEFPEVKARKINLENQRVNFEGQLLNEKQEILRNEFEEDVKSFLQLKPGKQTHLLSDYERNEIGIPIVLGVLVCYFKTHKEGLKEEGLFRKSVSIEEENEMLGELSSKNYDYLLRITNPHLIANLIKRFFSNLKEPLFPYPHFGRLMHDQGISNKKELVMNEVNTLPKLNYLCLMFLVQFLKDDVIGHVEDNKMTALNLSICFAPCLLRAEKPSPADLIFANKCAMVVRILLQNFSMVFGDAHEIQRTYMINQQTRADEFANQINQSMRLGNNLHSHAKVQKTQSVLDLPAEENTQKQTHRQKSCTYQFTYHPPTELVEPHPGRMTTGVMKSSIAKMGDNQLTQNEYWLRENQKNINKRPSNRSHDYSAKSKQNT